MKEFARALLVLVFFVSSGCSSTKGGKGGGMRGHHAVFHWDLHAGVGSRIGLSPEQVNKYKIHVLYKPGDGKNSTWYYMDECSCHAWNEKTGNFKHNHVYASAPDRAAVPAWLGAHESLHEYIESSVEHGGNPLPDEYRRGGNLSHPNEVYMLGKWRKCRSLVGGRWPAIIAKNKPVGGVPPLSCQHGKQANNWHR